VKLRFGYIALVVALSIAAVCFLPAAGGHIPGLHGLKSAPRSDHGAVLIQFDGKLIGVAAFAVSIAYFPVVCSFHCSAHSLLSPRQFAHLDRVLRC
jgi:hypothetical protein